MMKAISGRDSDLFGIGSSSAGKRSGIALWYGFIVIVIGECR